MGELCAGQDKEMSVFKDRFRVVVVLSSVGSLGADEPTGSNRERNQVHVYLKLGMGEPWAGQSKEISSEDSFLIEFKLSCDGNCGLTLPIGSRKSF